MKRITILFLISLLTAISGFSEDIYPKKLNDTLVIITSTQLKQSNLIFLEKEKLSKENKELEEKIVLQNQIINNYIQVDSLRVVEQQQFKLQIENLNKEIRKKSKSSLRNGLIYGGIAGISLTSILFLLLR